MLPMTQGKGSCKSCRENKAQCDKKRPRCSECVSANKACGGYDLGSIFINISATGPAPLWSRSQNSQKYLVLDLASQPDNSQQSQGLQLPPGSWSGISTPSRAMTASPSLPALADIDPTNIRDMTELFLDVYYRRFGPGKTMADPLQPGAEIGGWRNLLPLWIGQSGVLDAAIGALAACFVGSQYRNEQLVNRARNMYLDALQKLQKILPEPEAAHRPDLLATTLVMSSTELFLSNYGGSSQRAHIDGATRLLECMSEDLDSEGLHSHVLALGLFEALNSRRSYSFSSPSHSSFVQRIFSSAGASRNNLYFQWCESVLPLPNILVSTDGVANSPANSPSDILAILDDLTAVEHSLANWYTTLKASAPGAWTFPASQVSPGSVPFPLQFNTIEACTLYNLFWASQLLVLEARATLFAYLPTSAIADLPPIEPQSQLAEYASLICRSVQYCTSNTSFAATENMFVPLGLVAGYYQRQADGDRTKWCVSAFSRIAREHKIVYVAERVQERMSRGEGQTVEGMECA
ncbi:hypothetical protein P154DRAFT_35053 [Amniculicola lignicola CBS 123094]|uniref:Zn(2)-C6 fungal-type domain-containing protein n=1 Tax=Amniculicola lignicola CBS 123094 TaxID=1392246 RepID=A0A6A5X1Y5_9PLEO|nr:hypothetical protein P154DRAFT_35053 [Amniculicola lignicola CBS 123094]